jgi:outer membrane protein OmpA-like peptidoglycan-associated protein
MARVAGAVATVSIIGQTDVLGGADTNRRLSEQRARTVLDAIEPASFSALVFETKGISPSAEGQGNIAAVASPQHRRASLDVAIQPAR